MTDKPDSNVEVIPAKVSQEAYGGDRQAMTPLVALLVYGGMEGLKFFQGICDGITSRTRIIFDEDINKNVEFDGAFPNFNDVKVELYRLEGFLKMALRDSAYWSHPVLRLSPEGLYEAMQDCADPLYEKLYQGELRASGIRAGEHRRGIIEKDEWRELTLVFKNNAAGVDAEIYYESIEIQHPHYRLQGSIPKRGQKTNVVEAAVPILREAIKNGVDISNQRRVCMTILKPKLRKQNGTEYSLQTLESHFGEIMEKLRPNNK